MTHPAIEMYDYHVWEVSRIMDRLKEIPEELYRQEIASSFPSIAKTLAHIYIVDNVWFQTLQGTEMADALNSSWSNREELENGSLPELETKFKRLSEACSRLLRAQEDLEKRVMLNNPYAGSRETSLAEIVMQIVTHGTYHKGNISTMLRQTGNSSVMTDYIYYLYAKQ
ncbi:DinB family protein [Paenibacillus sp. FSL M7-1455]|uniref:DinB family protein n=1 Tax=Paenibacillus sp. FSL M7-1455 TaxID=2975316 RepID=UPI0030FA90F1